MKLIKKLLFAALVVVTLSACKKSGVKPAMAGIYNAGYIVAGNSHSVAVYWKNGTIVKLADSTYNTVANGIALDGNDIYVIGTLTTDQQITVAVIWKNGVMTKLTDGTSNGDTRAIAISDHNVYIAGFVDNAQAAFWKNGVQHDLAGLGFVSSIAINGNDVYVAGAVFDSQAGNNEMAYYKNGNPAEFLPNEPGVTSNNISGSASAVLVNSNNVYLAGYANGGQYWVNRTQNDLPNGYYCYPSAITVRGNDVYIAGSTYVSAPQPASAATYWKNGAATQLTDGSAFDYANAITLDGSDIYIAGTVKGSAVYWKNGQLTKLATHGVSRSIVVIN